MERYSTRDFLALFVATEHIPNFMNIGTPFYSLGDNDRRQVYEYILKFNGDHSYIKLLFDQIERTIELTGHYDNFMYNYNSILTATRPRF